MFRLYPPVIASEAKQSQAQELDCFVVRLLAVTVWVDPKPSETRDA